MIGITVKSDVVAVRRQFAGLGRQIDLAASRALNRAIASARTVAVRDLSRSTGIKPQAAIRDRLPIKQASPDRLAAEIGVHAYTPNLVRFAARQTRAGVSASAWGKRKVYRGTFLGNNGRTVFKRAGKARLPIKPVYGPRLAKEFVEPAVIRAMNTVAGERWRKELNHELQRRAQMAKS
jgi:hypothetical protein